MGHDNPWCGYGFPVGIENATHTHTHRHPQVQPTWVTHTHAFPYIYVVCGGKSIEYGRPQSLGQLAYMG